MAAAEASGERAASGRAPAWRRRTAGEHRWPAALAILAAAVLQVVLPDAVVGAPRYLLPAIEVALLLVLLANNPFRIDRPSRVQRTLSLAVLAAIALSNAWSEVLLVHRILAGHSGAAGPLLAAGAAIWLTNVLTFGLAYWEFDRGGPAVRAAGERDYPDFAFPQMQSKDLAPEDWEPALTDYLYLSFTNATAFSPTDVMPLSRWAKLLMMLQSAVALAVVVLVVARAINALS
jgi:uncharacterized membrane protein